MFTPIVIFALLPILLSAPIEDQLVIVDVAPPSAASTDGVSAKEGGFWTSDKFLAAKPLDRTFKTMPKRFNKTRRHPSANESPSHVSGSLASGVQEKVLVSSGLQVPTTGRIFFSITPYLYSCSGCVINSQTGDLILTAGHCVFDTTNFVLYSGDNWVFVPAYANGKAPYGTWSVRRMAVSILWMYLENFDVDVGFVALNRLNNQSIQNAVGSQSIAFNQARLASTYSYGYPANINNAQTLSQCLGAAQRPPFSGYGGQGLPCNMGPGCSGGPWLQNVNQATGAGFVTSVNSFSVTGYNNIVFGPYFGSAIQLLYNSASKM